MSTPKSHYLEAIAGEGQRLLTSLRSDPDVAIPHYPTWTMRDLAVHTAGILVRTTIIATERAQHRVAAATLPPGEDAIDWFERSLADMLAALVDVESDEPVWSFLTDQRIAAWERRMTVEIGVHRWDAQDAIGRPDPLPEIVATSGLDEFPVMFHGRLGDVPTITLRATDIDLSWTYGTGATSVNAEGSASDLFLRLMARPGAELPPVWAAAVDGVPNASV